MNVPTLSAPWFVLSKVIDGEIFYYPDDLDSLYSGQTSMWTTNIKKAFFFLALKAAARIADDEKADVMVIYSKGQIKGLEEENV